MLNEGRRRANRGTDVVVGLVESHGRALTEGQIGDLEVVPRRTIDYRGAEFTEMDVDAVLARKPDGRAGRRARAHQRPGLAKRKALARRRRAPRRRHRRNLHREHPAPGIGQRRRRADHRSQTAGDDPRRDRPRGRAGRARRHDARGAASTDGARQHLSARADRHVAGELLPHSATSPRCARSRCCGLPTRWKRASSSTCEDHGIEGTWEHASESWSRSPVHRVATS